jgi:SAM-dependent methyltransferase
LIRSAQIQTRESRLKANVEPNAGYDTTHFVDVTEMAGQKISAEQLSRTCHRYYWARAYVEGKDVLEVACGAGQGLGYLARHARSVAAGDISAEVLEHARKTYGNTLALGVFDAGCVPYPNASFDAVLLFEAIYYLPDIDAFMREARRVLRPGGHLLIATANKDLYDFNPSPFSVHYYGVKELAGLCHEHGFAPQFWGYVDVTRVSLRQRVLRPVKLLAARLGVIPTTMGGKEFLKKLFFGSLVDMPASILDTPQDYELPVTLTADLADRRFKVIYCAAKLR